ncbi:Dockerin type I repeat protein [Novipirellula aureliae]|uniref:Dockerin type I repeat protein n=1 Tax=Novipirellula aureliae TaxID=2527966 RepID=A0A5C6DJI0_9BACT|nr:dockerin type I domain-containing protein [Novipirellula aureliae]TWU37533.1 Dockerin type I repeat protein [Novipirellula aureliae]
MFTITVSKSWFGQRRRTLRVESLEQRCMLAAEYGFEQPMIDVSSAEQLMVERINWARANPSGEASRLGIGLNDDLDAGKISTTPKQPLAPDASLSRAAELHSLDMILRDYFAHDTPEGVSPWTRAANQGYTRPTGENIAFNWTTGGDFGLVVQEAHDILFRSAGHRVNLMLDRAAEVGIGIEQNPNEDPGFPGFASVLSTQMFGSTGPTPAITGVVYSDSVIDDDFYSIGEGQSQIRIEATDDVGKTYWTSTGDAGGYALRIPKGTYTIVASDAAGQRQTDLGRVVVDSENIKLDVLDDDWDNSRPDTFDVFDCNHDGNVTAADALLIINRLGTKQVAYDALLDVNHDNKVTAGDALMVINELQQTPQVTQPPVDAPLSEAMDEAVSEAVRRFSDGFTAMPDASEIVIESSIPVIWTNSKFNLRDGGDPVPTAGYQIVLRFGTVLGEYRASTTGGILKAGNVYVNDYMADGDELCCPFKTFSAACEQAVRDAVFAILVGRIHSTS